MKKHIFISMAVSVAFFFSCDRLENTNTDATGLKAAEEEVLGLTLAEAGGQDDQSVVMEPPGAFLPGPGGPFHHHLAECATVTERSEDFPKEITIDFDSCTDWRGFEKSGQIIISISDTMTVPGATATVTYVDFSIGMNFIEGTKTLVNAGLNGDGNHVVEEQSELTITKADGTTMTRSGSASMEWIEGFGTPEKYDDIFYLSGTGSLTLDDGTEYSRTITEPLLVDRSCRFILSGTVEIVNADGTAIIDFGDGTCDDTATVTANGESREIDLGNCRMRNNHRHHHRNNSGSGNGNGNGNGNGTGNGNGRGSGNS